MRASGQKEYLSLAKGLVTEASELAFPENSTVNELNFTINKDGLVRSRRQGFENLVTDFTRAGTNQTIENVFYWREPSLVCVVITDDTPQTVLRFHASDADFTFITEVQIATAVVTTQVAQTTNVLIITSDGGSKPILCEHREDDATIQVGSIDLYVRDFELVDDGLSPTERPATLSENHEYNLYNAGWWEHRRYQNEATQPVRNPITSFFNDTEGGTGVETGVYPSNADIVVIGISVNENGVSTFRPDEVKNANLGNTVAPRGHYVFSISDFVRETKRLNKNDDGVPSDTLTAITTVDISGVTNFDPENPEGGNVGGSNPTVPSGEGEDPPVLELP